VRLYDRLFTDPAPDRGGADFMQFLNPDSLRVIEGALVEPGLAQARRRIAFPVRARGLFRGRPLRAHAPERPVFNRTIGLRDVWAGERRADTMALTLYNTRSAARRTAFSRPWIRSG
jgi:glutaminyl-tRNA synthetase